VGNTVKLVRSVVPDTTPAVAEEPEPEEEPIPVKAPVAEEPPTAPEPEAVNPPGNPSRSTGKRSAE